MNKVGPPDRPGPVERIASRETVVVFGAVGAVLLVSGIYTVLGVGMDMTAVEMTRMAGPIGEPMEMAGPAGWSAIPAVLLFLMWWMMMIAMMTPGAAPVALLHAALARAGPRPDRAPRSGLWLLGGYLLAWGIFSVLATMAQLGLVASGHVEASMMTINSRPVAGLLLIAAGAYQFTSLKAACLRHCRSPAQFLALHGRPGTGGAFATGLRHGIHCLGCCWALMALLFVGGVMNLFWIAGIAIYVLAEKLVPGGKLLSRATGVALVAAGAGLVATAAG